MRKTACLFLLYAAFLLQGPLKAQTPSAPKEEGPANTEAEFQKQYNERITKDRLNGVYIPKNLDEAMTELDKRISEESRGKMKMIPEDSICQVLHFRLGEWIMLNWGFYGGSRLSHYLKSAGVTFPDDMADFIILAYHRRLNQKPIDIKDLVTEFREKRKKEHDEELKNGKVIYEEVRKKN